MRTRNSVFLPSLLVAGVMTACVSPDAVVRKDSGFTKESTLTLTTEGGSDPVNLIPSMERELLRRGFNIISRSVAQTETQTRTTADDKAAGRSEVSTGGTISAGQANAAAIATGSSNTTTSVHQNFQSKYVGKLDYSYSPGSMRARDVNLTIIELATGKVAVSVAYSHGYDNTDVSTHIGDQLARVTP